MTVLQAVQAVKAVDALKRKPEEYKYQSFFSQYDLWQFIAITDDRTCAECMNYDTRFFTGTELRLEFMFLEISRIDPDTIYAHVHPNCRCLLTRIYEPTQYIPIVESKP